MTRFKDNANKELQRKLLFILEISKEEPASLEPLISNLINLLDKEDRDWEFGLEEANNIIDK
jgi:hypothetical protein